MHCVSLMSWQDVSHLSYCRFNSLHILCLAFVFLTWFSKTLLRKWCTIWMAGSLLWCSLCTMFLLKSRIFSVWLYSKAKNTIFLNLKNILIHHIICCCVNNNINLALVPNYWGRQPIHSSVTKSYVGLQSIATHLVAWALPWRKYMTLSTYTCGVLNLLLTWIIKCCYDVNEANIIIVPQFEKPKCLKEKSCENRTV